MTSSRHTPVVGCVRSRAQLNGTLSAYCQCWFTAIASVCRTLMPCHRCREESCAPFGCQSACPLGFLRMAATNTESCGTQSRRMMYGVASRLLITCRSCERPVIFPGRDVDQPCVKITYRLSRSLACRSASVVSHRTLSIASE
jgi:hypothetical protein